MNPLRKQSCKNENTDVKRPWYDWLINYIPELIKNGGWCQTQNYECF